MRTADNNGKTQAFYTFSFQHNPHDARYTYFFATTDKATAMKVAKANDVSHDQVTKRFAPKDYVKSILGWECKDMSVGARGYW